MNHSLSCEDKKRVDILLLSGFLGAGKTTLVREVLSWETDLSGTVVIVNEFGKVGIDGALLEDAGTDVVELASGCVCCSLKNDLRSTLMEVHERFSPDRIILEASGVADPTSIKALLEESALQAHMQIHKTVTVFDADYWEAREAFGPLFMNQLNAADLILLNKIDLLDKETVSQTLEQMHGALPKSRIVPTLHCQVDPDTLWEPTDPPDGGASPGFLFSLAPGNPVERTPCTEDITDGKAMDASGFVSFSFEDERVVDEIRFKQFMKDLPHALFRVKGSVRFLDRTELINHVGGRSEWRTWDGKNETMLVFIGWDIDSDETLVKLGNCLAE